MELTAKQKYILKSALNYFKYSLDDLIADDYFLFEELAPSKEEIEEIEKLIKYD